VEYVLTFMPAQFSPKDVAW